MVIKNRNQESTKASLSGHWCQHRLVAAPPADPAGYIQVFEAAFSAVRVNTLPSKQKTVDERFQLGVLAFGQLAMAVLAFNRIPATVLDAERLVNRSG